MTSLIWARPALSETKSALTHGAPRYSPLPVKNFTVDVSSAGGVNGYPGQSSTIQSALNRLLPSPAMPPFMRLTTAGPSVASVAHFTRRSSSPRHARYGTFVVSGSKYGMAAAAPLETAHSDTAADNTAAARSLSFMLYLPFFPCAASAAPGAVLSLALGDVRTSGLDPQTTREPIRKWITSCPLPDRSARRAVPSGGRYRRNAAASR